MWEQSDTELTEWEAFLANWLEIHGTTPVTPKELVRDIESGVGIAEAVPMSISDAVHGKGDSYSRVGCQFRARLGKRYGLRGLRLEKGPQRRNGNTWLVAEDGPDCEEEPMRSSTTLHTNSRSETSSVEGVEGCTPQTREQSQLHAGEIIPCENGLRVENPPQPSTLHWTDENYEEF